MMFDNDSTVYLFPSTTRINKIKGLKPYVLFKKDKLFKIEELPLVMKDSLDSHYGEYYEVFYDYYSISEWSLNERKIDYVKTTIGSIKDEINREIEMDTKFLRKDR